MLYAQTTWYVDDDAPGDPGPGDPSISDPLEDGSQGHPFDAIQEGIDAAVDADTVLVLDGTYTGAGNRDLDFAGRLITVRSENGPEDCVIDCSWEGVVRGFYLHSGETADAVVDGFTITNGDAGQHSGGGICCRYSSPTIRNCAIVGNRARGGDPDQEPGGGGIYCVGSSLIITDCIISENTLAYGSPGAGGGAGICCVHSDPIIVGCTITGNTASADWGGGGVYCRWSRPLIANCTISGNAVPFAQFGGGGGISCTHSDPIIADCTIIGNTVSTDWGGGVSCVESNATITNCTIMLNSSGNGGGVAGLESDLCITNCAIAQNTADGGGGVYSSGARLALMNCLVAENRGQWVGGAVCCGDGIATIDNCTVAHNATEDQGGGVFCDGDLSIANSILWGDSAWRGAEIAVSSSGTLELSYSDVQGGEAAAYVEEGSVLIWREGNINADPLFVDPDGPDDDPNTWEDNNFRLGAGSPCIDAGCNCAVPSDLLDLDDDGDTAEYTPLDLDGEGRFFDDPATQDTGSGLPPIVDMGAYEFGGSDLPPCHGDLDADRDVDYEDLIVLLTHYGMSSGATGADGDMDCDGDVELSDLAALLSVYGTSCE